MFGKAKSEKEKSADEAKAAKPPESPAAGAPAAADLDAAAKEKEAAAATEAKPEAAPAVASRVGRKVKVTRNNALYGEAGIITEEKAGGAVHVKLTGPCFRNDAGVVFEANEFTLVD